MKKEIFMFSCIILLLSCTENLKETKVNGKVTSVTITYVSKAGVQNTISNSSRAVDPTISSYTTGYQFGCAAGKDNSLLSQPHIIYLGIDLEQYSLGFNNGFRDCSPPPIYVYPSTGGNGVGGNPLCSNVHCAIVWSQKDSAYVQECEPATQVPCSM